MSYQGLKEAALADKQERLRLDRRLQLYRIIYKSLLTIVKHILPADKHHVIATNVKSIIYAMAELQTGQIIKDL